MIWTPNKLQVAKILACCKLMLGIVKSYQFFIIIVLNEFIENLNLLEMIFLHSKTLANRSWYWNLHLENTLVQLNHVFIIQLDRLKIALIYIKFMWIPHCSNYPTDHLLMRCIAARQMPLFKKFLNATSPSITFNVE